MGYTSVNGGVCAPKGFKASGIHCGIRNNRSKKDLAMIYCEKECSAAAIYTQNKVYGAPITVTREHLSDGRAQAIICNSGIANTCVADGVDKARTMGELAAAQLKIKASDVIVASTGVIGVSLDLKPIENGLPELVKELSGQGGRLAAEAIMTTDTKVKQTAISVEIGDRTVTIGAMGKGSGMIHPNMATMLIFVTTDADIGGAALKKALAEAAADSYNMISIDGDTSTNDMVCVMASGLAGNSRIPEEGADYEAFRDALLEAAVRMSRMIAADGEGATKLIECRVKGAPEKTAARVIARSVVSSSLTKAAMFGADANWGRVLCAIGYAQADFSADNIDVDISSAAGRIAVCRGSSGVEFSEEEAKRILSEDSVSIDVEMNQGAGAATAWGCDLTYDYVKINGDYRT